MVDYEKKLSKVKIYKQNDENDNIYKALVPYKKKRNIKKIILFILTILLILSAVIFFLLNFVFLEPDAIFKKTIAEIRKKINNEKIVLEEGSVVIASNLSLNIDLSDASKKIISDETLNYINNTSLEITTKKNAEDSTMYIDFDILQKDDSFKIKSVINDEQVLFLAEDLLDKYIYMTFNEKLNNNLFFSDENKYVRCADLVLDAFSSSLNKEYFSKSKTDEGTKNTLILDNNNLIKIMQNLISGVNDRVDFLETLADILGTSTPTAKSRLEVFYDNLPKMVFMPNNEKIEVSIYIGGINRVKKIKIEHIKDSTVISYINVYAISNNEFDYEININDQKLNGKIINEKNQNLSNIKISFNSTKHGRAVLNVNQIKTYDKENVINLDLSSAISIKELTLQDTEQILKNVMKNNVLAPFLEILYNNSINLDEFIGKVASEYAENEAFIQEFNTNIEEMDNILQKDGIAVKFKIPNGYVLDKKYSNNVYKYFDDSNNNIQVYVAIKSGNEKDYFENVKKYDYEYKIGENETYYNDVKLDDIKEVTIDNNKFKYQKLRYKAGNKIYYEKIFYTCAIRDNYLYVVEVEARNSTVLEDLLKEFIKIEIK